MSNLTVKAELAQLINRLTDRIFPDTSEWSDNPSPLVRYGAAFLGTGTWAVVGGATLADLWQRPIPTPDSPIFVPYSSALLVLPPIGIAFAILYAVLIGASVRRGTPLNFYLWGLFVPILVTNALRLTFS